jgi:chemotaxis signal transduction protein
MTTMVCFDVAGAAYCLPVHATRSVRTVDGLIRLPDAVADVTGILPGDPPLTVISPLHARGTHVLVLDVDGMAFGLLVDAVTGIKRVDEADIRPAPAGQDSALVCGTLESDGRLLLVADAKALAARL